jgi:hypothetical protein
MIIMCGCKGVFFFPNSILNEWGELLIFLKTKVGNHSFKTSIAWLEMRNI